MIPDRLIQATGGMGENLKPILEILSDRFDFYIVGLSAKPEQVPSFLKGYTTPSNSLPNINFSPVSAINIQIEYFISALQFPKPDIVIAYDWSVYLPAVRLAKHYSIPLIVEMCLSPIMLARDGFYFGLDISQTSSREIHHTFCEMEKIGLFEADKIIQISNGYSKRFLEVKEFQEKTSIVPMCIDFYKWQNKDLVPYELPGTRKKKVIFIGRFVPNKGISALCQAKIPNEIDLIFIGAKEMADKTSMQAILDKCDKENNVHYIGPFYGEEKVRIFKSADAVIIPSLHEPFGIVGLEGLASRCIVLSSRVDGLGDFLNDETSIFCGTSPLSIEKAFEEFLQIDENKNENMKKAGFEICQNYTSQIIADKLLSVINEVGKIDNKKI